MSKYDVFARRAARASAQNTAFVYNSAEWGEPAYMAMTALKRHSSFGFNDNPIIEVSSLALAERLADLLNAGELPKLAEDYTKRNRLEYRRQDVRRRNRVAGMAVASKGAARRALRIVVHAPTKSTRAYALDRAARASRRSAAQRKHAREIATALVLQIALADPNSPESRAREAAQAERRERIAARVAAAALAAQTA